MHKPTPQTIPPATLRRLSGENAPHQIYIPPQTTPPRPPLAPPRSGAPPRLHPMGGDSRASQVSPPCSSEGSYWIAWPVSQERYPPSHWSLLLAPPPRGRCGAGAQEALPEPLCTGNRAGAERRRGCAWSSENRRAPQPPQRPFRYTNPLQRPPRGRRICERGRGSRTSFPSLSDLTEKGRSCVGRGANAILFSFFLPPNSSILYPAFCTCAPSNTKHFINTSQKTVFLMSCPDVRLLSGFGIHPVLKQGRETKFKRCCSSLLSYFFRGCVCYTRFTLFFSFETLLPY